MITIKKEGFDVIVEIQPTETKLKLYQTQYELLQDNIYFKYRETPYSTKIIREKGNIEDLKYSDWLCIKSRHQPIYKDDTMKSLDVAHLITEGII